MVRLSMLQGNGRLRESLHVRKGKQVTMYTVKNYKTKRELKADVAAGKRVEVFQPGGFFPGQTDGKVTLEVRTIQSRTGGMQQRRYAIA